MLLFCYNDILYFFSIKVCISFVRFIILYIIANDIFKLHYLRDCIIVVESLSRVRLFVTPWTVAHQSPLSMGFPRQEYWSGLPFPSPGDLPDSGIDPGLPALVSGFFTTEPPEKPHLRGY